MTKEIYLVKSKGYSFIFKDGSKSIYNNTINYHCCTTLEEAQNDVLRYKEEQKLENEINEKEGKTQVWYNYEIQILKLYGD